MQESVEIPIKLESEEQIPVYATEGASGADLFAFLSESRVIQPGETALIPTGVRVEIPLGYEIQVRPRSGLALRHSITVLNTPGTIDSDYRGEISVILINHGKEPFHVVSGMRIAQMVVVPVVRAFFVKREAFAETARGEGGFGHTGLSDVRRG